MTQHTNPDPASTESTIPLPFSRRALAGLLGGVALSHAAAGDAREKKKGKFGSRHPHRPRCAGEGESPSGTRKRKGRKPRPGKRCCKGLVLDATGVCVQPPETCHVCSSGCPYPTVQAAVADPAGPATVRICAGTYTELVNVERDVTLIGAGSGDDAQATVLRGTGGGSVLTIAAGRTVSVERVRITGGVAEVGGGIASEGDLSLADVTVIENAATYGGGIYSRNGSLSASNSTLSGNAAADSGGGLYNLRSAATLANCEISGNTAIYGGGIDSEGSSGASATLELIDTTVSGNTASNIGGGFFLDGPSTVSLDGCTVRNNSATNEGGGLATDDTVVNTTIAGSTFSNNTATSGGGIFNVGVMTLRTTSIRENTAIAVPGPGDLGGDGGGIYNAGAGELTIESGEVTANQAAFDGGGVFNAGAVACSTQAVTGNTAGSAGTANCSDQGGAGCSTCNA